MVLWFVTRMKSVYIQTSLVLVLLFHPFVGPSQNSGGAATMVHRLRATALLRGEPPALEGEFLEVEGVPLCTEVC